MDMFLILNMDLTAKHIDMSFLDCTQNLFIKAVWVNIKLRKYMMWLQDFTQSRCWPIHFSFPYFPFPLVASVARAKHQYAARAVLDLSVAAALLVEGVD